MTKDIPLPSKLPITEREGLLKTIKPFDTLLRKYLKNDNALNKAYQVLLKKILYQAREFEW